MGFNSAFKGLKTFLDYCKQNIYSLIKKSVNFKVAITEMDHLGTDRGSRNTLWEPLAS